MKKLFIMGALALGALAFTTTSFAQDMKKDNGGKKTMHHKKHHKMMHKKGGKASDATMSTGK